jgi:hypothetical protein
VVIDHHGLAAQFGLILATTRNASTSGWCWQSPALRRRVMFLASRRLPANSAPTTNFDLTRRPPAMSVTNGKPPEGHLSGTPIQGEPVDPLTEAEALRTLLQEAAGRGTRLIAALKQQRRQSRAIQAAMASLRKLQHADL